MKRFAIAVFLLAAVTAYAQTRSVRSITSFPSSTNSVLAIKGVPFSAETVTEINRVLQDGNRITQVKEGKVFRDSEGRTRHESSLTVTSRGQEESPQIMVDINDPIEQLSIHFVVSSQGGDKVAHVHRFHSNGAGTFTSGGTTSSSLSTDPSRQARPRPAQPVREDLGTKTIENLTVRGTKTTRTIEAGAEGNELPIVSVTEAWYSRELHQVLLTETDDPRSGHQSSKFLNIRRSEPDPALFQVPPDYAIKED